MNSTSSSLKRSANQCHNLYLPPPPKRRCLSVAQLVEDSPHPFSPSSRTTTPQQQQNTFPLSLSATSSIASAQSNTQSTTNSSCSIDLKSPSKQQQPQKQKQQSDNNNNNNNCTTDKFTKSRAVGQSHRDNEREYLQALSCSVTEGRAENLLLYTLYSQRLKDNNNDDDNDNEFIIHSHLSNDLPEDYNITTDEMAEKHGLIKLTSVTAERLGQTYISPTVASALMEIIISRRNLISQQPDPCDSRKLRRRRSSYRYATTQQQANSIINYAINQFSNSFDYKYQHQQQQQQQQQNQQKRKRCNDKWKYIDNKLGSLGKLFNKFDYMEKYFIPESLEQDATTPPSSPTRPQAAEFDHNYNNNNNNSNNSSNNNNNILLSSNNLSMLHNNISPSRKRGEGAKRCSRCHKLKISGSGHGRSKCDDGLSISSTIPYPAPPKSTEDQQQQQQHNYHHHHLPSS